MAKMLGRNLKGKFCNCHDCGGAAVRGRTGDKREGWKYEERAEGEWHNVPEDRNPDR